MPHADSSYLPSDIKTKTKFWEHVYLQLQALLEGQANWVLVSNCANASSLIYSSLLSFEPFFGADDKAVNWCGFYLDASLFPAPTLTSVKEEGRASRNETLLLGPFCGRPACQFIHVAPGKARGVCADAYTKAHTIVVSDVNSYPGHIACDGETKSEIVCPLLLDGQSIGVLDLDCLALNGFDADDQTGLERIAKLVVDSCRW